MIAVLMVSIIGMFSTVASGTSLSGTVHDYIVTFNDNNQATVAASITQTNYTSDPLTAMSLTIPGDTVSVSRAVMMYTTQEKKESVSILFWDRSEPMYGIP